MVTWFCKYSESAKKNTNKDYQKKKITVHRRLSFSFPVYFTNPNL